MIRIIARGSSESQTEQLMESIAQLLRERLSDEPSYRQLGPAPAPMEKLRGKYRFHMILQTSRPEPVREALRAAQTTIHTPDDVQWMIDIDPLDMM